LEGLDIFTFSGLLLFVAKTPSLMRDVRLVFTQHSLTSLLEPELR